MFTPDTLYMWLRNSAWPIGILLVLGLVVFAILRASAAHRRASMLRERSAVTEDTFVEELAARNFDPAICATTWRYLREVQRVSFPLLPSDRLDEDLGLDEEEVEQSLRELSVSLRRRLHSVRLAPVITVEDLVRRLQSQPRITAAVKENAA